MQINDALAEFKATDYFVWDDFLSAAETALVLADYKTIEGQGDFTAAGIGKAANLNEEVRTDRTYWINPSKLTTGQNLLYNRLNTLKDKINEHFHLGLWNLEGHYSFYPIDGHYQKHLDRFSCDDARTVSMVLYLNSEWTAGDGGELKLFPSISNRVEKSIDPIGGRLICFLSAEVLHEVLQTHKPRMSYAGWWKTRP